MKAITESKGKAKEYSRYSCNTYYGCGIGCNYNKNGGCYAAAMAVRFGWFDSIEDFQNNPRPKEGIIDALRKDAKKLNLQYLTDLVDKPVDMFTLLKNGNKPLPPPFVLLSFMTDPYQPINEKHNLTRQAIEILHDNGLGVNILTKGKITDWDLLAKNPHLSKVGITYTGAGEEHEPCHKDIPERIHNLYRAHEKNIQTWVSLEPIISPESVLFFIELYSDIIDEFKIGKWNYSPEANKIDWRKFTNDAIELLEKLGSRYYIKADLRGYLKTSRKLEIR